MLKEIKSFFQCIYLWIKLKIYKKNNKMSMSNRHMYKRETNVLDVDLLKDVSEKDRKKVRQYTKVIVTFLMICAVIWVTYSYVLASIALFKYGDTNVLSDLSKQVCVTILGVVISYCLKSYFESYSEAKHNLDIEMLNNQIIEENNTDNNNAVG